MVVINSCLYRTGIISPSIKPRLLTKISPGAIFLSSSSSAFKYIIPYSFETRPFSTLKKGVSMKPYLLTTA